MFIGLSHKLSLKVDFLFRSFLVITVCTTHFHKKNPKCFWDKIIFNNNLLIFFNEKKNPSSFLITAVDSKINVIFSNFHLMVQPGFMHRSCCISELHPWQSFLSLSLLAELGETRVRSKSELIAFTQFSNL